MDRKNVATIGFWSLLALSLVAILVKFAMVVFNWFNSSFIKNFFNYLIAVIIGVWAVYFIIFNKEISKKIEEIRKKDSSTLSIIQHSFNYLLIAYLILVLLQQFDFLRYVNLNYLLATVIVSGLISVIFSPNKEKTKTGITRLDILLIWVLGILAAILIYVKTKELGWLSYTISIIGGILMILLGYLIYEEDKEENLSEWYNVSTKNSLLIGFSALLIISIIVSFFTSFIDGFRIVFGSVYVLFLPGYVMSYIFFDEKKKDIDWIERIAISFALSISVVPLLVYFLNLMGMKINALNVSLVVLVISSLSYLGYKKKNDIIKK